MLDHRALFAWLYIRIGKSEVLADEGQLWLLVIFLALKIG